MFVFGLDSLIDPMKTTFSSFGVTVAWDLAAFVICIFIFNYLRRSEQTKKVYAPKRYITHEKYIKPRHLPSGHLFGWVRTIFSYSEEDIIKTAGFDAAVYLRIFSFAIRLFTVASIFNLLIVLPVNLTADRVEILQKIRSGELSEAEIEQLQKEDASLSQDAAVSIRDFEDQESQKYEVGSFDKLSMTNVSPRSQRLWAHLVAIWFMTLFTLKLLWQYHAKAVKLRIQYLATTENGADSHTVLVRDIPGLRFGSPLDRVMRSRLFKFLPQKIRKQVEMSLELLFSVATEGVDRMAFLSTQLAKNVAVNISQRGSRPKLRFVKNKKVLKSSYRWDSFSAEDIGEKTTIVKAEDITDMDPIDWVTSRLKTGIPLEKVVERQFRDVYPNGLVESCTMIYDTTPLEKLMEDYEKTVARLEDLIDHYRMQIKKRELGVERMQKRLVPVVEGKWAIENYGAKPLTLDLMMFYVGKLQSLKMRILEAQEKVNDVPVPAAFITFKTRWAQVVAATSLHHHFQSLWHVESAPHPDELVWPNLNLRAWERYARGLSVWGEFTALSLFFFIPVTFVQGMIQMDRLKNTPVLGSIITFPLVNGALKGLLPNLALRIFLAILPRILKNMSYRQGFISLSEIDFEVVRKYFIFQTITIFFYSFISSTLLDQVQEIIDDPKNIIDILGISAPRAATFFITYILYTGLFEGGIGFLNIPNLIELWLMERFAGTERAKARVWSDQTIEYGPEVPAHTFTILLGLAFSVVNPIVLPATLLYFLAMRLTWTYNLLYIYSEEYQSGGRLWEYVFEQVLTGLMIMQAMTIFLMAIKKFPYLFLLAPLPFITIIFRWVVHKTFDRPLKVLSLRAAHDLDTADQEEMNEQAKFWGASPIEKNDTNVELEECKSSDTSNSNSENINAMYQHPSFQIDWEELDILLKDARNLDLFINSLTGRVTQTVFLSSTNKTEATNIELHN